MDPRQSHAHEPGSSRSAGVVTASSTRPMFPPARVVSKANLRVAVALDVQTFGVAHATLPLVFEREWRVLLYWTLGFVIAGWFLAMVVPAFLR